MSHVTLVSGTNAERWLTRHFSLVIVCGVRAAPPWGTRQRTKAQGRNTPRPGRRRETTVVRCRRTAVSPATLASVAAGRSLRQRTILDAEPRQHRLWHFA